MTDSPRPIYPYSRRHSWLQSTVYVCVPYLRRFGAGIVRVIQGKLMTLDTGLDVRND